MAGCDETRGQQEAREHCKVAAKSDSERNFAGNRERELRARNRGGSCKLQILASERLILLSQVSLPLDLNLVSASIAGAVLYPATHVWPKSEL